MKFEAVLFEVMRAVMINCKLTWPGLSYVTANRLLSTIASYTYRLQRCMLGYYYIIIINRFKHTGEYGG